MRKAFLFYGLLGVVLICGNYPQSEMCFVSEVESHVPFGERESTYVRLECPTWKNVIIQEWGAKNPEGEFAVFRWENEFVTKQSNPSFLFVTKIGLAIERSAILLLGWLAILMVCMPSTKPENPQAPDPPPYINMEPIKDEIQNV